MNNKRNIVPVLMIAFAAAIAITFGVRLLLSSKVSVFNPLAEKKELSIPDIPLMVKEAKKQTEVLVLVVSKAIKKDSKIKLDDLSWKKWPLSAIQSSFIAKDEQGVALNNSADYNKVSKKWAANDILSGVPITMSMLIDKDPKQLKEEEEKKAKEAEERRKEEQRRLEEMEFIKKGMRAVTFPIDQKSASSLNVLTLNDLVDVLIMERRGDKTKTHKYIALKILAIDGATKFSKKKEENNGEKKEGEKKEGANADNGEKGLAVPKTVTLEVKEEHIDSMIKQLGNGGVILSIRSKTEQPVSEEDAGKEITDEEVMDTTIAQDALLRNIVNMNKLNSGDAMVAAKNKKESDERNLLLLMKNMSSINSNNQDNQNNRVPDKTPVPDKENISSPDKSEKIEFVSGKSVGEEEEKSISVRLYRKLKAEEMQFDRNGKKATISGEIAVQENKMENGIANIMQMGGVGNNVSNGDSKNASDGNSKKANPAN